MTFVLTTLFLFILGTAVGSFINVMIYRSVRSQGWVKGRSRCDHCHKLLPWYNNIPLLSFVLLKGKSACCKQKLSLSHPVVEFLSGSLFVWWYWGGSLFFKLSTQPFELLQPLFWLLVGIILLGIFFADILYMIIPDFLVVSLSILAFLYRLILLKSGIMQVHDFIWMIYGTLIVGSFFAFLFLITKGKGFGFGDVKFSLPMGLLLAWPSIIVGALLSFIFGSIFGVFLLLLKKKKLNSAIPFGPFLILGTVFALVFGDKIWFWYLQML